MATKNANSKVGKNPMDHGVNFKDLAEEYAELMKFKYIFVLDDFEDVEFRFWESGFYHLLGFHKIKDTTIVEIIDGKKMISKKEFFRNVANGNINYDYLDLDSILGQSSKESAEHKGIDFENIRSYKNTVGYKSELGKVINNRWLCFSKERILKIFGRRVVLNFENGDYSTLIEADRVFFQFLKDKKRHINLFVKYNSEDAMFHPVTFFLEDRKDDFLVKEDGTRQKKINILVKRITDIHTNKDVEVEIIWSNVREALKDEPEYIAQSDLYSVFSNYHIKSGDLVEKIEAVRPRVPKIPDIYTRYDDKEFALNCIEQYERYLTVETKEEKEELEIFFMELEECIDIESKETHAQFQGDFSKKALKLYGQITRYEKMLPLLRQLEIKEVKYLYSKFFNTTTWSDNTVRDLIEVHDCFDNNIPLTEVEQIVQEIERKSVDLSGKKIIVTDQAQPEVSIWT